MWGLLPDADRELTVGDCQQYFGCFTLLRATSETSSSMSLVINLRQLEPRVSGITLGGNIV